MQRRPPTQAELSRTKINATRLKSTNHKKLAQQYSTIKKKTPQMHCQLHLKVSAKLAASPPRNSPACRIELLSKDRKAGLASTMRDNKFVNMKHEENAEFDSEEEACAYNAQTFLRRPLPYTDKEKMPYSAKPEFINNSFVFTEADSKSPIELDKDFAHNVPLLSDEGDMYLRRMRAVTEMKDAGKVLVGYRKKVVEGVLLKRFKGGWKAKYCMLRYKSFVYFNYKGSCRVKGCLQFGSINCHLRHTTNSNEFEYSQCKPCRLIVVGCSKRFKFRHDSGEVVEKWVECLREETKLTASVEVPRPGFWKVRVEVDSSMRQLH
eukprot:TRINITY_DN2618_c0_g3_i3.p1 TRINITY_DN2618_c0_g3~~TRINITY_DN2618_c0_g3_i3.p1  ORF type:complete len:321 (-),score=33.38 TRINITY_DN2618_c0_g3_i3:682-1644(-)